MSRALIPATEPCHAVTDLLLVICVDHLPASNKCIDKLKKAQATDPICSTLISYCEHGWPEKHSISSSFKPYWKWRSQLTVHNVWIPYSHFPFNAAGDKLLQKLHEGHQGIQRCRLHAKVQFGGQVY